MSHAQVLDARNAAVARLQVQLARQTKQVATAQTGGAAKRQRTE